MGKPRYDLTIYTPLAARMYVDDQPAVGGAERQMVLLARSLARLGLRVCHIVADVDGLPARAAGVDLMVWHTPRRGPRRAARARCTLAALASADASVYLQRAAGFPTGLVGGFARLKRRGFIYSTSSAGDLTHGSRLPFRESIGFRIGLRLANAVVVQTRDQEATAPRRLNVVRIPSFCEPPAPSENGHHRDSFLWIGRPASYKNPLAFVQLARDVPEARFLMVGIDTSPSADDLSSAVLSAAAAIPNLRLLPPLPPSAIAPLYQGAIAVVNTSEFEGFPNTFMEGWARGALALSLNVDPDRVITRFGIGATARGSAIELAAAARRMWHQRNSLAQDRALAMRYVAEHHAPESVAKRWLDLVTVVASSSGADRSADRGE